MTPRVKPLESRTLFLKPFPPKTVRWCQNEPELSQPNLNSKQSYNVSSRSPWSRLQGKYGGKLLVESNLPRRRNAHSAIVVFSTHLIAFTWIF